MIKLTIGEKCDESYLKYLDGTDTLKLLNNSPMDSLLTLSNITEHEKKAFHGKFTIGLTIVEELPFLVFDFGLISFDTAIYEIGPNEPEENAMNLILIENNGNIIEGMRTIGVDVKIMELLLNHLKKNFISHAEYIARSIKIQRMYSTKQLLEKAVLKQHFEGLKWN